MITIICPCGRKIITTPYGARRKKYCSKKCFYKYRKRPKGLKYKIVFPNKGWFKKGCIPWSKGKKGIHLSVKTEFKKWQHPSPKTEFKKGDNFEEKNHKWLGDNVGYGGIHDWLQSRFGYADKCENRENDILNFNCSKKSNNYDWALLKGLKYERKRENFIMLCHSCHLKYDKQKTN